MARKIDALGRIVLPAEMRQQFGIQPGDSLDISVDGETIALRKIEQYCVFCGTDTNLAEFQSRLICSSCNNLLVERSRRS